MSAILLLVRRSLRQHALSTIITVLGVALATGLVMAVFSIRHQAREAFIASSVGYDAVLGARGSQLQLVLNTVFHLETSPGNIPWSMVQQLKKDGRVKFAIPYALGDNYHGFRIVGTSGELFTDFEIRPGQKYTLAEGAFFNPALKEAVIGSFVAQKTGLQYGDTFNPYHGLTFDPATRHDDVYVVKGVLAPTNTPADRVIWIPIEGIWRMEGHVGRSEKGGEYSAKPGEEIPDEFKEVSAVMLKFSTPHAGMALDGMINKQGKVATLAWPIERSLLDLFDKIGWMDRILELVSYLVVLVSAGAILASIYNTMNERRRELAILRALGARRSTVFTAIVAEAGTIAFLGSLLGFVVYLAILAGASIVIRAQTGVVLELWQYNNALVLAPLGMIALGKLAGIIPALKAYRVDVAENLSPIA